ncbi:MAG: ParB N-terminal domain-containing protein [Anaerolineaceae bacterium]|nr:ParB N-terminal domain-containing protein [Anaerolineaceae bacterium]
MIHQKELEVLDIYLDSINARHDPLPDQHKIIDFLVGKEKIKQLGKDIAENGLSPIENIAVIESENGHYIAIEGNRRLCALQLLNDPSKHPSSAASFARWAEKSNFVPSRIICTVFDSREEADVWIERKHQGEQDGIGPKNWNPKAKDRHYSRKSAKGSRNALAVSLIDYAAEQGMLDKSYENRIITTAQRYLGNPYFRKTMGIVSSRSEPGVKINCDFDQFDKALEVFITDLIDGKKVSSRTDAKAWEEYARELIEDGIAPKLTQTSRKLEDRNKSEKPKFNNSPIEPKDTKSRNNRNPESRKYLIPSDFRLRLHQKNLKKIFDELRTLEIDQFPLAGAMLARVFLENIYELYYEKITGKTKGKDKIHVLLMKIIAILEADSLSKAEKNALGALKTIQSNEEKVLSPKSLGANAHGGVYPNSRELKREFDNIESIIKFMLEKI